MAISAFVMGVIPPTANVYSANESLELAGKSEAWPLIQQQKGNNKQINNCIMALPVGVWIYMMQNGLLNSSACLIAAVFENEKLAHHIACGRLYCLSVTFNNQ